MSTAERSSANDITVNPIFMQHLAAYEYASQFTGDKIVLELGCGEGYGTVLLAKSASKIFGIDYSKAAIDKAQKKYRADNIEFVCSDVNDLGFDDASFEVIIAFQFIEHLKDPRAVLLKIKSLLKPQGIFLLSSPNKKASIVQHPYHFREYDREELEGLLRNYFAKVEIYGLQFSARVAEFREKRRQASQGLARLDFLKLHQLLPRIIRQRLFDLAASGLSRKIYSENKDLLESITTADFRVAKDNLDNAIDLIGLCQG